MSAETLIAFILIIAFFVAALSSFKFILEVIWKNGMVAIGIAVIVAMFYIVGGHKEVGSLVEVSGSVKGITTVIEELSDGVMEDSE